MATYEELRNLYNDGELLNRTDVAVAIAAHGLISGGAPTAEQQNWASYALSRPRTEAEKALRYVLAENSGLSVSQIRGADDAALQSAVDAAVPALVVAFAS